MRNGHPIGAALYLGIFGWHNVFHQNFFNIIATVTKKCSIDSSPQAASIGAFRFTVGLILTHPGRGDSTVFAYAK